MKRLAALLLILAPLHAQADVIQYNQCKLNAGKTLADVQAWLNDWRGLAKKEGIQYKIRLLLPHAEPSLAINDFFIEGTTPTFESYGKAYQWWYAAPSAQSSNAQLTAAASCNAGSAYRTAE